jgi:hypothetical protein
MKSRVFSMMRAKSGRSVGREAARMPISNSMLFQIKYESFLKESGSAKTLVCNIVLYMEVV